MESRHLHPNLARLAASYDDILEQFARDQLSAQQARQRISALVSRDDQGVQWCINPDDGQWHRITLQNEMVRDDPPEVGLATYTGWDLSGGDPMADPRHRIIDEAVDPRNLNAPESLVGSTARFVRNQADEAQVKRSGGRGGVIVIGVLILLSVAGLWMAQRSHKADPVQRQPLPAISVPGLSEAP